MSIANFELIISKKRLRNCSLILKTKSEITFSIWDKKHLYDLYMINEDISKELRFVLSQFEIILRNQINKFMISEFGDNWLLDFQTNGLWLKKENDSINTAKQRILDLEKEITHDLLLSKLNFSFWTTLFNKYYQPRYLYKGMKVIFPRNKHAIVKVSFGLSEFRLIFIEAVKIRNKVSHQEFILREKYKLPILHSNLILLMNMMDRDYYGHFEKRDHFQNKFIEFKTMKSEMVKGILKVQDAKQ